MENIYSRLSKFIEYKGISNNEFGRVIGCSSAQITQMLTYKKNFGVDKILKIVSNFSDINPDWLLLGKGEMLRDLSESNCGTNTKPLAGETADSEGKGMNKTGTSKENTQKNDACNIGVPHECIYKEMLREKDAKIEELSREAGELRYQLKEMRDKRHDSSGLDRHERMALDRAAESVAQYGNK
jgi:plasmid maintenance system antidote protein VapI